MTTHPERTKPQKQPTNVSINQQRRAETKVLRVDMDGSARAIADTRAELWLAENRALAGANDIQIYFADPYSPWQRGSNENANGLIREYLPKGTDLSGYSQAELTAFADRLNDQPRRILDYQSPRTVFANLLSTMQIGANSSANVLPT